MKTSSIKTKYIFCLFAALAIMTFTSCGSSKQTSNSVGGQQIKELVNSKNFEIENDWVSPLRGSRISLIGNPNYIRFKNGKVDLFLPYFGVRHSGGGYNSENGIKYKGEAKNLQILENEDKGALEIQFEGRQGSESLDFYIKIFSNGKANTSVNSSDRDAISYQGEIKPLQVKEE